MRDVVILWLANCYFAGPPQGM